MRETKHFLGKNYSCDNREYEFKHESDGVRVDVDGNWWMPPKPFPPGFDRATALFDSIENAVSAVSAQYGIERFFDMDENDRIIDAQTPAECAKVLAKQFASNKPKRKRRSRED